MHTPQRVRIYLVRKAGSGSFRVYTRLIFPRQMQKFEAVGWGKNLADAKSKAVDRVIEKAEHQLSQIDDLKL